MSEGRTAPKKYYQITEKGKQVYQAYESIWKDFQACVEKLCGREV